MKAPAFLGRFVGVASAFARKGPARLVGTASAIAAMADRKTRLIVASVALAALCCAVAIIIVAAAIGADAPPSGPVQAAVAVLPPGAGAPSVPRSGPALASMLLIPGADDWPWPLALEPKAIYTEAEAAGFRPDLGAIDVTDLSARRKAELETIFGAVD